MTEACKLNQYSKLHIQEMLLTPQISEQVFADVAKGKTYKLTEIRDDGTIYLGETSLKWWNTLFRIDKEISFETFVLRVFSAIAQMAGTDNKGTKSIIVNGLSKDMLTNMLASKDFNVIVDRLYDTLRFAIPSSPLASKGTHFDKNAQMKELFENVRVTGAGYAPVYDSTGKVLLHIKLEPTGYTFEHCQRQNLIGIIIIPLIQYLCIR